jgi:hypothetical protein
MLEPETQDKMAHRSAGRSTTGQTDPGGADIEELRQVAARSVDPDRYRSYLLRLWRESPGEPWRCQVQCVGAGDERRFAGLAEMLEFLLADAAGEEGEIRGQGDPVTQ